ncbi:MAG: GNAT family N-acetyltransferase, partial [Phycisphaerales bacterium]|nr:GNAT family N-acetyltransferase [Phycisphaerales bacterium]
MPHHDLMTEPMPETPESHLRIRHAAPDDHDVVSRLCLAGEAEGAFILEPGEPFAEDFSENTDTDVPVTGFWVAEQLATGDKAEPMIIGMLGLRPLDGHVAEARRLYVEPAFRGHGVGMRLLEQLVSKCRDSGYLKVILDVGEKSETALRLFNRLGFQLARERETDGRTILDFYLDIYRDGSGCPSIPAPSPQSTSQG